MILFLIWIPILVYVDDSILDSDLDSLLPLVGDDSLLVSDSYLGFGMGTDSSLSY